VSARFCCLGAAFLQIAEWLVGDDLEAKITRRLPSIASRIAAKPRKLR
jgi:hypothetical protein